MKTTVLIIGGGATGAGLARDLSLRGVDCVLLERRDLNAGASGANHGLLHSGARYVASDPEAARECREEGDLLKELAPQCIEDCTGLFVAVPGDDENYIADFPALCEASGIKAQALDPAQARETEPSLAKDLIAAYQVPDAALDPFMLCLDNVDHARSLGARVRRNTRVTGFHLENGRIRFVQAHDLTSGEDLHVEAELVINATGAWAGMVAGMAGIDIPILFSKGTLLVTQNRISQGVINRLRKPGDSDILVPGGTVSILGTTSVRIESPEHFRPTVEEVDQIIDEGSAMIPSLAAARYIRAYAGVRPLVGSGGTGSDDRNVSRGVALIDHTRDNVDNFVTITGGKLTTFRLMAEQTADLVCEKLGHSAPCLTRTEPLPASNAGRWTEPGLAPKTWITQSDSSDTILCECEMVSKGVISSIVESLGDMKGRSFLRAVGLRSRVGKGPCQGSFCSPRVAAHLYNSGQVGGDSGLEEIRAFVNERWRGKRPVLWDLPMVQAELQEALHCGLMDLELPLEFPSQELPLESPSDEEPS